jgi:putative ATP-binding cassette transporter
MKLLELLSSGDRRLLTRLTVSAALSGGGGALLLAIVNSAAEKIVRDGVDKVDWVMATAFVVCALIFFFSEIYLIGRIGAQVETGIDRIRTRLLDQIAGADFAGLERFGQARLYESITQSSQTISQNSQHLALAFRSLLLVVAVMIYIFWLSKLAFFLVIGVVAVGSVVYLNFGKKLTALYYQLGQTENRMFERVADLFAGIKEIRMSSRRSDELAATFEAVSKEKQHVSTSLHDMIFQQSNIGMVAFYILLAVVVFVVPTYSPDFSATVMKVSTAVLFMIGPISTVVQSWSVLGMAESAAGRMMALSSELEPLGETTSAASDEKTDCSFADEDDQPKPDDGTADHAPKTAPPAKRDFNHIRLAQVEYRYANRDPEHGFHLGPVDMEIHRGEIVFVTGGNGSGKSTLIRLLTALYRPNAGDISVDQMRVGRQTLETYRSMIATVFSDFHLFGKLYGLQDINPEDADKWLRLLEIDHVVGVADGHFTTTDLSQGQRKRLGLVTALLEDRPVLVLDEWAADQDPYFRRKFYHEILPVLKADGKTIIAVTHDDHYFDSCDRRYHLEGGKIAELGRDDPKGRL